MSITTRNGMVLRVLSKLGIAEVPPTRPEYIIANNLLDGAVNICLSKSEMIETIYREKLILHAESDLHSYRYEYSFPTSMLKPLNLLSGADFYIEGHYLYTTEETTTEGPVLRFIKRDIALTSGDTGWSGRPEFFYEIVAFKCAELAAKQLNKEDQVVANMISFFHKAMLDARVHNLESKSGVDVTRESWGDGW